VGEKQPFAARAEGARLVVSGDLDVVTVTTMYRAASAGQQHRLAEVDLDAVTFIDSTGVYAVLTICRWCGGKIVAASEQVRRTMQKMGLGEALPADTGCA
jgi:anti-anti-sigma factor